MQVEIARLVLSVTDRYGFALGGGLALVLHGVVDRPTEDVDLFADSDSGVRPAAEAVEAALRRAGFQTRAVDGHSDIAEVVDGMDQYMVEWELRRGGRAVRLSLSCLARLHAPVVMDLGPVMDLEDLIAWKVAALVGRARERDYIDVAAVLDKHGPADLLALARRVDPGLEDEDVPVVGRRLDRLPDEAFFPYRLGRGDVAQLRRRFAAWPR
ncbi:nucleotidyl transferase AbiEii/AbiGii toxin family protein [Micromonospora aurantiaca (nom. illeg.)]|uniref:nucleotidyl transferase AbiEii/AbiGii toxin family protein n=1 Tax=Micromonospora aurantiaca (nom. illeg.) TaxID=47850 RepID=UPI0033FD43BA